jgi:hypothetical protein
MNHIRKLCRMVLQSALMLPLWELCSKVVYDVK